MSPNFFEEWYKLVQNAPGAVHTTMQVYRGKNHDGLKVDIRHYNADYEDVSGIVAFIHDDEVRFHSMTVWLPEEGKGLLRHYFGSQGYDLFDRNFNKISAPWLNEESRAILQHVGFEDDPNEPGLLRLNWEKAKAYGDTIQA